MTADNQPFFTYTATIRSKATWGTDTITQTVPGCLSPLPSVHTAAHNMGASVTAIVLEDPLGTVRAQLKECLGFVDAWRAHLAESGNTKAAETVQDVLERSRVALRFSVSQSG